MNKKTKSTALSGLLTALSVIIMLPTLVIPVLTYVSPMVSGIINIPVIKISGKKFAWGVYFATSLITLILLSDKEASLLYITFFGYFPIIYKDIGKLKKLFAAVIKFVLFNLSTVATSFAAIYIFKVPVEEFTDMGKYSVVILLLLGNVAFIFYDIAIKKYIPILENTADKLMKNTK